MPMMRRTVLLLVTTALALIAAGGIALATTFTCTTDPCDGTADADFITGTDKAETINGHAGDDWINGGDGPDRLLGENGTDQLNGGAGDDILDGSPATEPEDVNDFYDFYLFNPNWGNDTIIDSRGHGVIRAEAATAAAMPNLHVNFVSDPTRPEVTDGNGNTMNWENNDVKGATTGAGNDVISQRPKVSNAMNGGAGSDTYQGYTTEPTGSDNISDPSGTADVLDLSSRSLTSASWTTPFKSSTGGNAQWLRIDFHGGGFFLCEEPNCDYLDIGNYFDSTSTDVCASGPGAGLIETIKFADDPSVDFAQVKSLLGCSPPDTTPPMVNSTSPPDNNATGIASTANVSATFSEAMDASTSDGDASTINGSTFTLTKPDGPDADTNPDPVAGVVNYNSTTKMATLDPTADLDYSTTYTATVTTGAEDLAGNHLDQDPNTSGNQPKTWSFTTAAGVSIISPSNGATGVLRTTMVTAQFSEDVDGATVKTDTFMLGKGQLSSSQLTDATRIRSGTAVSYVPTTKTAKLDPYGSKTTRLARCQWYTAKVTSGIKDKAGNPAVGKLWSFKTKGC
jgi:hypothetical protein